MLREIADYFNVSLDYLTKSTNKRDYDVSDDSSALFVINKLETKEISYFDLLRSTMIELELWISSKSQEFNTGDLNSYFDTANNFIQHVNNEVETMKWYTEIRKKENQDIENIYEKLALDEDYNRATQDQVLEFMIQSERVGYHATRDVLEYMVSLPGAHGEE